MIIEAQSFCLRHKTSGLRLAIFWVPYGGYVYNLTPNPVEAFASANPWHGASGDAWDRSLFRVEPAIVCSCCGSSWIERADPPRCEKHRLRNPCIVEGCTRTRLAEKHGRLSDNAWICGEHWRRFVPTRSARRRAHHRFFRLAKKHGGREWPKDLERRYWRFWNGLVKVIRRESAMKPIDVAEVVSGSEPPPGRLLEELKRIGL